MAKQKLICGCGNHKFNVCTSGLAKNGYMNQLTTACTRCETALDYSVSDFSLAPINNFYLNSKWLFKNKTLYLSDSFIFFRDNC